jgi:hypothetical protein
MTNVITLYFFPGSRYANGVGIFKAWENSKQYPDIHHFIQYLVNWVAGTKLIFIFLLIVILYIAEGQELIIMGIAMAVSISSFFWRLFPLIRKMDKQDQIEPKNYSRILAGMILIMVIFFIIGILI